MKKWFKLICVVLLFCVNRVEAQCPTYKYQFEFLANYGHQTADEFNAAWTKNTRGETLKHSEETSASGPIYFSARYYMYSCLSVGLTCGINHEQGNNVNPYGYEPVVTSTYTKKALTVALEIYYIYKSRKYYDVYTYLGCGPSFTTLTTTNVPNVISSDPGTTELRSDAFTFHYSPVGVRVGGRIGGFAELGYGYKGLISGGLSVRLGKPWWRY